MSTLLRIISEHHTTYINLNTIHVINHDRKHKSYSLNVVVPDGNYNEIGKIFTFSKREDPLIYEQIKTYVKKRCHDKFVPSKTILPLVNLDT